MIDIDDVGRCRVKQMGEGKDGFDIDKLFIGEVDGIIAIFGRGIPV